MILKHNSISNIYKVFIWGIGNKYSRYCSFIKNEILKNHITVLGISSYEHFYRNIDNFKFVDKDEIIYIPFDFIIDCSDDNQNDYLQVFKREKIIRVDVFSVFGFDFIEYVRLRENPITIISMNCFGYYLYNCFDLPYSSPTIGSYIQWDDFIVFLSYLSNLKELQPKENILLSIANGFPVINIGESKIFFSHYDNYQNVIDRWNRRISRINYNNIFVCLFTDNEKQLNSFNTISYKKICFTSFKTDVPDTVFLPQTEGKTLRNMVNSVANLRYPILNTFELLTKKECVFRSSI